MHDFDIMIKEKCSPFKDCQITMSVNKNITPIMAKHFDRFPYDMR